MYEQESQNREKPLTINEVANLVFLVCWIWHLPLELVLRRRIGRRYIDLWFFAALFWPMVFCAFVAPRYSMQWTLWAFWGMWLLAIYHRLYGIWLDRQGDVRHTQYPGDSIFSRWLPCCDAYCKSCVEPTVCILVGILAVIVSPSLMLFILGALFAGVIKSGLIAFYQQNQLSDLHDMRIEQEHLAQRFRNDR